MLKLIVNEKGRLSIRNQWVELTGSYLNDKEVSKISDEISKRSTNVKNGLGIIGEKIGCYTISPFDLEYGVKNQDTIWLSEEEGDFDVISLPESEK